MMEAARTSETLVNFYQTTRRYNTERTAIFVLTAVRTSNPTNCEILGFHGGEDDDVVILGFGAV
jgi:hypothetical protein